MSVFRYRIDGSDEWVSIPALKGDKGDPALEAYSLFDDLQSYASKIQDAQSPTTLTLAMMSDAHYCKDQNGADQILDTANTMALLSRYVHVDAIANLGDYVRGDEVKSTTRDDLSRLLVNTQQNANCPVFHIRGNHDDNGWHSYATDGNPGTRKTDEMFNDHEWYQWVFGHTVKDVVTDPAKPHGGYGYYDHEASKIRVFLLNSVDIPYIVEEDGTYRYNSYQCCALSNEQLNFVANSLQFADKQNPNDWAAMFLMHIPLDTTAANGYRFGGPHALVRGGVQMLCIIDAYRKGISYSFSGSVNNSTLSELAEDFTLSIDVDYSSKGCGDVICFVNGHTHTDNVSKKVGYDYAISRGYAYLGIIGSNSFATFVVDRENSKVTVFKYGEVRTQSESEGHNPGAINGETEMGIDMSTGVWVVPFDQFRPTGENLYNGLSETWSGGYKYDTTATLDTGTLEMSAATANENYALAKAVAVKQYTQYIIPSGFSGTAYFVGTNGKHNGSLTPVDGDGYKIITTRASGGYLVFNFYTKVYTDYANFYIKELVHGL